MPHFLCASLYSSSFLQTSIGLHFTTSRSLRSPVLFACGLRDYPCAFFGSLLITAWPPPYTLRLADTSERLICHFFLALTLDLAHSRHNPPNHFTPATQLRTAMQCALTRFIIFSSAFHSLPPSNHHPAAYCSNSHHGLIDHQCTPLSTSLPATGPYHVINPPVICYHNLLAVAGRSKSSAHHTFIFSSLPAGRCAGSYLFFRCIVFSASSPSTHLFRTYPQGMRTTLITPPDLHVLLLLYKPPMLHLPPSITYGYLARR